ENATRARINKNAYTGMSTLYTSYSCSPIITNCSGVNAKKTQNNARWSPGRVGVSVINSRKAQNEIRPKKTVVAVLPKSDAAASIEHISHHARIRRLNVCTAAELRPVSGCRLRI